MNQTEELLAGRRRREAQVVPATIESAVGDGTGDYYCIVTVSGARVRASVAASGTTHPVRFPVLLAQADDGTVARTSGFVIHQHRAIATQGTQYSLPTEEATEFDAEAVTYISPESVTFSGAGSQAVVIHGAGLDDVELDYGSSDLSASVGPVQTAEKVAVTVTYAGGGTPGTFDLTVGDLVFPDYFTIAA